MATPERQTIEFHGPTRRMRIAFTDPDHDPTEKRRDVWIGFTIDKNQILRRTLNVDTKLRSSAVYPNRNEIDVTTFIEEMGILEGEDGRRQDWKFAAFIVGKKHFGKPPTPTEKAIQMAAIRAAETPIKDTITVTAKEALMTDKQIKALFLSGVEKVSDFVIVRIAGLIQEDAGTALPPPFTLVRSIREKRGIVADVWRCAELLRWKEKAFLEANFDDLEDDAVSNDEKGDQTTTDALWTHEQIVIQIDYILGRLDERIKRLS